MKFSYPSGAKPLTGYTVKRGIGIGGFGEVYFALNDAGKEVALKKIQRNLDIELRGVRQCLNIRHVNLISLWDIQTSKAGESWVVMEYVPGPSLRDILEDCPRGLPEQLIKQWFTSIASGVAYLHHRGIVHRDLKPENVFRDDDAHVIKIGDYGLSKFISSNRQSGQTGTVGTVHYMAPEISKGEYGKEVDIYALGIMLYEMLTGDVPFDGETSQEIMYKHLLESPHLDSVGKKYRDVLAGCLDKESASRFSNVAAMISEMPWQEFAGKSNQILSLHSVGVFPKPDKSNTGQVRVEPGSDQLGARIEPILISNQDSDTQMPALFFGPVVEQPEVTAKSPEEQDRLRRFRKTTPPRSEIINDQKLAQLRARQAKESGQEPEQAGGKLSKRTTVVGMEPVALFDTDSADPAVSFLQAGVPNVKQTAKDPRMRLSRRRRIMARKLSRKYSSYARRLANKPMATPGKFAGLVGFGWLVLTIPQVAFWAGILISLMLVAFALMKTWAKEKIWTHSPRSAGKRDEQYLIGQWMARRPVEDQIAERLGELLVAAATVVPLSFLFCLAQGKPFASSPLEFWALFAWVAATVCTCVWALLVPPDPESDDTVSRGTRLVAVAAIGFVTAGFSAWLAKYFYLSEYSHATAGHMACIVAIVIAAGWVPVREQRRSRLSLVRLAGCFVVGSSVAWLVGLGPGFYGVLSVAVAASHQFASAWLSGKTRSRIRLAFAKSGKAVK